MRIKIADTGNKLQPKHKERGKFTASWVRGQNEKIGSSVEREETWNTSPALRETRMKKGPRDEDQGIELPWLNIIGVSF